MDRERPLVLRTVIVVCVIVFAGSPVRSQDRSESPSRTTFGDLAVYQEPTPTPPAPRPAPPQTTNPPAPTPRPGSRAEAAPIPSTAPAPTAAPGGGSSLNAAFSEAFDRSSQVRSNLAGLRPSRVFEFLGDRGGGTALFASASRVPPVPGTPPPLPGPNPPPGSKGNGNGASRGLILAPSIRSFKIAEDQSPRPLDRVYYFFNYFDNVNHDLNRRFGAPVGSLSVYRSTFGFEKTFDEGRGSIGFQLPTNSLTAQSGVPGIGGTTTTVGDLSLIYKYAFLMDQETGSLMSGGLAVTTPTGSSRFAGTRAVTSLHYPTLQPFVGYLWNRDRLFIQGFTSVDVPTNSRDVTFLFNDFAVGYFVYRDDDSRAFLSSVVPTFEVHVNTPLNHRRVDLKDPAGTPDIVDFTYGLSAMFYEKTKVTLGIVTPVTDPRPFSMEVLAQLTYRF